MWVGDGFGAGGFVDVLGAGGFTITDGFGETATTFTGDGVGVADAKLDGVGLALTLAAPIARGAG